jgi:hypothetical protein
LEGKLERGRLPAGPLGIQLRSAGHAPWLGMVNLTAGARREVEVLLSPARRVSGLVRSTTTGEPIAGASVVLSSSPAAASETATIESEVLDGRWFQTSTALTDDAGRFVVTDAREGELRISVRHPEHYDPAGPTRPPVTIAGGDVELDPVELAPGSSIQVTLDGWNPPGGPGLIYCVDALGTGPVARPELRPSQTAGIDASGRCRIDGLAPGAYELRLRVLGTQVRQGSPPSLFPASEPQVLGTVTVGAQETAELTVPSPVASR